MIYRVFSIIKNFLTAFCKRILRFKKDSISSSRDNQPESTKNIDTTPIPLITGNNSRVLDDFRRRYCKHVKEEYRLLTDKGLRTCGIQSLEIDQVFIEVSLALRSPNQVSRKMTPEQVDGETYSIWSCLKENHENALIILGPPGCGKTTLLQYLAFSAAGGIQRDEFTGKFFPILLLLREHASAITSDMPLADLLQQHFSNHARYPDLLPPTGCFAEYLNDQQCLLLLDGLDEITDAEDRKSIAQWIERQNIAHSQCHVILTSRPIEYLESGFGRGMVMELLQFSQAQASQFIGKWYDANERECAKPEPQQSKAEILWQQLKDHKRLQHLYRNPLLLKMMILVNEYRGKLPDNRADLYEEICSVLLVDWPELKGITGQFSKEEKQSVLEFIAFEMMENKKNHLSQFEVANTFCRLPIDLLPVSNFFSPKNDFKISEELKGDIIKFITEIPSIEAEQTRHAFIIAAAIDDELKKQLDFSGSVYQFSSLLVENAYHFGKESLENLLQEACNLVGMEKKRRGKELVQQLSSKTSDTPQDIPPIIREIERSDGLFIHDKRQDRWEFAHLTFQEYLCASYWKHYAHAEQWGKAEWQRFFNEKERWDETLSLYAAQVSEEHAHHLFDVWLECEMSETSHTLIENIADESLPSEDPLWEKIRTPDRIAYLRSSPIEKTAIEDLDGHVSYYRFGLISGKCGESAFSRPSKFIPHKYKISNEFVIDRSTALMWQRSGSKERMPYEKTVEYIHSLNESRYHDWRLPTIPELLSLMEPEKDADPNETHRELFLNACFDPVQKCCWSADTCSPEMAWECSFTEGYVLSANRTATNYVRAVRSYSGSSA